MVGCLALVGRGQWQPADIQSALEARDRAALGLNAPPPGLYFVEAIYPGLCSAALEWWRAKTNVVVGAAGRRFDRNHSRDAGDDEVENPPRDGDPGGSRLCRVGRDRR